MWRVLFIAFLLLHAGISKKAREATRRRSWPL